MISLSILTNLSINLKLLLVYMMLMYLVIAWGLISLRRKSNLNNITQLLAKPAYFVLLANAFFGLIIISFIFNPYIESVDFSSYWFIPALGFGLSWYFAMKMYMKHIFRVPESRISSYMRVPNLIIVALILSVITNASRFIQGTNSLNSLLSLVNSLILLITFGLFYKLLGNEIVKNSSKISKARIRLFQYVVASQFLGMLLFTVGAALFSQGGSFELIAFFTTLGIGSTGIMITILSFWAIEIPEFVRVQFNLSPRRFEVIKAIKDSA